MADNRIEIEATLTDRGAVNGTRKLKAGIEGVDAAGRKASLSLEGSFRKVEGAIGKVRKVISSLSFGSMMADSVLSLINRFKSWREEVRRAQVELRKLENERIFAVQARGVERLAEGYRRLTAEIEAAGKAAGENAQRADAALAAQRAAEDAKLNLGEEREVAALDRADPAYAEKVRAVRQRYAGARRALAGRRAVADAETAAKRYADEAFDQDVNAATYSNRAASAGAKAAEMEKLAHGFQTAAGVYAAPEGKIRNAELAAAWKSGAITPEILAQLRGMKPEEIVAYASERAAAYGAQAKSARSNAAQFAEKSRTARAASVTAAALAESQSTLAAAAETNAKADSLRTASERAEAEGAVASAQSAAARRDEERRAAEAAAAAKLASAGAAVPRLSERAAQLRGQIAAEQARKDAAGLAVFQAQGAYDTARANGDRRAEAAALEGLRTAQSAAAGVDRAADGFIRELTDALRGVETRLKAAQNHLARERQRTAYEWAEAPAAQ